MLKSALVKLHWLAASQLGVDPRRLFRSFQGVPRYLRDCWQFKKGYSGPMTWMPCLHDRFEEGGTTTSEYFWQDLLVARWIFEARPQRHVDVGSRVDGFVAHVASFRSIEVFDVRPVTTEVPGVIFRQADLMNGASLPRPEAGGYCDSLSCLHAFEHFGLGRYGDPIDPLGHERGLANMASMLGPGGTFYLSTPIGRERVEFNANRVFEPRSLLQLASANGLELIRLTVVAAGGKVREVKADAQALQTLAEAHYNLGIFVFAKS